MKQSRKKSKANCKTCGTLFFFHSWHTKGWYCSRLCSNKKPKSLKWKETMSNLSGENNYFFGKKHSEATREKIRRTKINSKLTLRGKLSPLWRGGITPINKAVRSSWQYKEWRRKVFERDDYTCQDCGIRSGKGVKVTLNADHIKPFSLFPELRLELSNGRTLCFECHKETPTYLGKIRNYEKNRI